MYLVITIPAYNEEASLPKVLKKIPKRIKGVSNIDIVVINDGSDDKTSDIIKNYKKVIELKHTKNQGLGKTFSDGIDKALELGADIIVNIDADNQFEPKEIPQLIDPLLKERADVALGSRFLNKSRYDGGPVKNYGNIILSRTISFVTKSDFSDVTCGFRAFSRDAALNINIHERFSYTLESIISLQRKGFKFTEVPITVKSRKHGSAKISKNIFYYGFKSISIIIRSIIKKNSYHFFGISSIFSLIASSVGFIIIIARYIKFGLFLKYSSLLTASISLLLLGILLAVLAFVFNYIRIYTENQERIIYYQRKKMYEK